MSVFVDSVQGALPFVSGDVTTSGYDLVFDGADPWSRAWRRNGSVVLEWRHGRVEISDAGIVVDSGDPEAFVDCFHNPIAAVLLAWRGMPCFHAFTASSSRASIALMGASGSGKSTTGLALLRQNLSLVNDDLLAIRDGSPLSGRGFVRRLPNDGEIEAGLTDVGGKVRVASPTEGDPPPLRIVCVFTDEHENFEALAERDAFRHLLVNPYLPVPLGPGEARQRFEVALGLAETCTFVAIRPKALSPDAIAARVVAMVD